MVMLVTHSLPNSCLVNLIDVTLVCEDAFSILVDVVTVADVSDEDLEILNLTLNRDSEIEKCSSFVLASSHTRVTSIKYTKEE